MATAAKRVHDANRVVGHVHESARPAVFESRVAKQRQTVAA